MIVFWQNRPSIHQTPLLNSLTISGEEVIQLLASESQGERSLLGWGTIDQHFISRRIDLSEIESLWINRVDAIHIFSGFHSFPAIKTALAMLYKRMPKNCYIFMERPDTRGWKGIIRYLLYSYYFFKYRKIRGVLSAGARDFIQKLSKIPVYDFPYFLTSPKIGYSSEQEPECMAYSFLYVGSLIERKNITAMCRAFYRLSGRWRLIIAGDGPKMNELINLKSLRKDCQIDLLGVVENELLGSLYSNADTFILPSLHDGYGAVVNEAALSGCRIICSNSAGCIMFLKEAFEDCKIFSPNDEDELLNRMQESMSSGKISAEERRCRCDKAATFFHPDVGAAKLLSIFSSGMMA